MHSAVRAELERDGLIDVIGKEHVFAWVDEAVAAFQATAPAGAAS